MVLGAFTGGTHDTDEAWLHLKARTEGEVSPSRQPLTSSRDCCLSKLTERVRRESRGWSSEREVGATEKTWSEAPDSSDRALSRSFWSTTFITYSRGWFFLVPKTR